MLSKHMTLSTSRKQEGVKQREERGREDKPVEREEGDARGFSKGQWSAKEAEQRKEENPKGEGRGQRR